jgi:hypothetical protein
VVRGEAGHQSDLQSLGTWHGCGLPTRGQHAHRRLAKLTSRALDPSMHLSFPLPPSWCWGIEPVLPAWQPSALPLEPLAFCLNLFCLNNFAWPSLELGPRVAGIAGRHTTPSFLLCISTYLRWSHCFSCLPRYARLPKSWQEDLGTSPKFPHIILQSLRGK